MPELTDLQRSMVKQHLHSPDAIIDLDTGEPWEPEGGVDPSAAIEAHRVDTTNVHGIADTAALASTRKVDLGVIDAVDLIAGPLDLNLTIEAVAGDLVNLIVAGDGFVPHDSDADIQVVFDGLVLLHWNNLEASGPPMMGGNDVYAGVIFDGGTFNLALTGSDPTVGSIHLYAIVVH